LAATLGLLAVPLSAQVVKVRDFSISTSRDRRRLFGSALTPSGQVLSFVAQESGEWALYRVSNWLGSAPSEEELLLPGFFSRQDRQDLETLTARVFVTKDGAYAICVGSAEWLKRVRGRAVGDAKSDDIISVVDLKTFKVVSSTRTRELGLLEFHEVRFDREGHLLVDSSSSGKPRTGAFVQLDIPSLRREPRCDYTWNAESPHKQQSVAAPEGDCPDSLEEYLQIREPQPAQDSPCDGNKAEFCRLPHEWTADGKFGIGYYSLGHDELFGGWVTTESKYIIFSTAKHLDIGEIKIPTNEFGKKLQTSVEGQNYILLIQGGTHFSIYELQD
jgi:hypothetical protein